MKFEYGKAYEKYDMSGIVDVGTGRVMVHDIFNPMPDFMKEADVAFCDPPYNLSALKGYYTKAGISEKPSGFAAFQERLVDVLAKELEIPLVILESGLAQAGGWEDLLLKRGGYEEIAVKDSYYYKRADNSCAIIIAGKEIPECLREMPYMDEEDVIEYICRNLEYSCIADPCMGQGLVGYYSNKYGKRFAGTELNPKRLAVCVDRVTRGKKR